MNAFDLLNNLTADNRLPVYFLYGPERFFATEVIHHLTQQIVTDDNRDFNFETFEGATSKPADWINSARTLSFFGGNKLVIVDAVDGHSWDDAGIAMMVEYAKKPVSEACLVMTALKADRKRKVYKALCALPGSAECAPPHERTLSPWLKQRAKAKGYTLSPASAERMVARIGPLVGRLASELDKVLTYCGKNKKVSEEDVVTVVGDIRLETIFALTDALKEKNPGRALSLLRNQLAHGEEPLKLLGTIAWQFRMIWEVKHFQKQNMPNAGIARAMGQKPFVVDKAARSTRNFSELQLKEGLRSLALADRELKTSTKDPAGIMETLVLKLAC